MGDGCASDGEKWVLLLLVNGRLVPNSGRVRGLCMHWWLVGVFVCLFVCLFVVCLLTVGVVVVMH